MSTVTSNIFMKFTSGRVISCPQNEKLSQLDLKNGKRLRHQTYEIIDLDKLRNSLL